MIEILKLFSHETLLAIADYVGMVIEVPLVPDTPEYDTFLIDVSDSVNINVMANFIMDCPHVDIMDTTDENKHILISLLHRDLLEAYIVTHYETDDALDKMSEEDIRKSLENILFAPEVAEESVEKSVEQTSEQDEPMSAVEVADQMVTNYVLVNAFVALGYRGFNLTRAVMAQFNDPIHLAQYMKAVESVRSGVVDKNIANWYETIVLPNVDDARTELQKHYQFVYGVPPTDVALRSFASACCVKVRETGLSSLSIHNHAQNIEQLLSTIKGNTDMTVQTNQNTNAVIAESAAAEEVTTEVSTVDQAEADTSSDLDVLDDAPEDQAVSENSIDLEEDQEQSEDPEQHEDQEESEDPDDNYFEGELEEDLDEEETEEEDEDEDEDELDATLEDILRSVPIRGQTSVFSIRTNLVVNAVADSAEVNASELRSLVADGTTADAYTPLRYSSDNEKFGALNEALSSIALFLSEYNENHKAIIVAGEIDFAATLEDQAIRIEQAANLLLEEETLEVAEQLKELEVDIDDLWNINVWASLVESATGSDFAITVSLNIRAPLWFASSKNLNVARSTVARLLGGGEYDNLESSLMFSCSTNALLTSNSIHSIFQAHASSTINKSFVIEHINYLTEGVEDDFESYEDPDDSSDFEDEESYEDVDSLDTINGIDVDRMANLCLPFDADDADLLFPMNTDVAFVFAISDASEEDAE